MKFTKIVFLSAFGVVLAAIQMSSSSETVAGEKEARAAEDAYANYQQYYQQYAEQQPQAQAQVQPNPFGIHNLQNKQDFASDIKDMLGPDAGIVIGGAGLAVGLLGLIGLAMQNVEFRGVCSATKALGNTKLTLSSTSTVPSTGILAAGQTQLITQLNALENAINNIATPSCTS